MTEQEFKEWREELDERKAKLENRKKTFKSKEPQRVSDIRAKLKNLADDIQDQIKALDKGEFFDKMGPLNYVGTKTEGRIEGAISDLNHLLSDAWDIEHDERLLIGDTEDYEWELERSQKHKSAVKQAMQRIR